MAGKEKIGLAIAGTSFLFIFLFAWLVWPTKYRYFQVHIEDLSVIVRVNRFTGETCSLIPTSTAWTKQVSVYKETATRAANSSRSGVRLDNPDSGVRYDNPDFIPIPKPAEKVLSYESVPCDKQGAN